MNCIEITRLMINHELWETTDSMFDDELRTVDGRLRFYSNEAVRFRNEVGQSVYVVPLFAWLWIHPLAQRLRRRVKHQH